MIKFNENKFAAADFANASDVNIIDGLVQLLNSWQYGLAQEAVCIAELEVLATADDRDLEKVNKILKWSNKPFSYRKNNSVHLGVLTKVNKDGVELLDEDGKAVTIYSARQLVPFALYNAIHELYNAVEDNL